MAFEITKWCMLCTAISAALLSALPIWAVAEPLVDCFFIFGDSIVDNGNNNNLVTLAKSDFPPYGIDTPNHRPTGRFTNNRTIADITGHSLPLPSPSIIHVRILDIHMLTVRRKKNAG